MHIGRKLLNFRLFFILCIVFINQGLSSCNNSTPEVIPDFLIEINNYSNNLTKTPGVPNVDYKKNTIIVQGTLKDFACRPITNAMITMWHVDSYGNKKEFLRDGDNDTNSNKIHFHDLYFQHGGRSYTNNLGEFEFITIMPGKYENRSPHINFKISHYNFADFYTIMFFPIFNNQEDKRFNMFDKLDQKSLIAKQIDNFTIYHDAQIFHFDIQMSANNLYKRY